MREDFQITTPQLDLIADTAVQAGASGARMTGGGFGGCVIALVDYPKVDALRGALREEMIHAGYPDPSVVHTHAGGGAAGQQT